MAFKIPDTPEELFRQANQSLPNFNKIIPLIVVVLILSFAGLTSFYTVEQDEVGVVRLFGRYVRTSPPGLHFKIPLNIERVDKVQVTRVFKEEFGFRTEQTGDRTRYSNQSYLDESLMLTGDLNVLEVTWIIQFRVKDPVQLLFKVRNPRNTIRDISESVMRQVIGDSSVSEALTARKNEISLEVLEKIQSILDSYDMGIAIDKVELQDVNPPDAVQASFNEVNEAEQEREKVINQSWEAYNKAIPKARGEAEKTIREAEGYALSRVKKAEGDAGRFLETWNAYKEAKDVTRKRLYFEAMEDMLPKAGKIYVSDPKANTILPLLNVNEGGK